MASLAPHETLELQELLSADSNGIKKLRISISGVKDADLKNYLDNYLDFKETNFGAVQTLIDDLSKVP